MPLAAYAQLGSGHAVVGRVQKEGGTPVGNANVAAVNAKGSIIAFSITDAVGRFSLRVPLRYDSCVLQISALGIERQALRIRLPHRDSLRFSVVESIVPIREVRVDGSAISRHSDTVVYRMVHLQQPGDVHLPEVLRRLPGIRVGENGQIEYNGLPINRFYVEGRDMLGGRYGIAVQSIQARDVESVEVLEYHQPVRALQGREHSQRAALNIRLTEKARAAWTYGGELAGGYRPLIWDARLVGMRFSSQLHTISSAKSNRMGRDLTQEIEDHIERQPMHWEFKGDLLRPIEPPLENRWYMDNRSHVATTSLLVPIGKESECTVGILGLQDERWAQGLTHRTYRFAEEHVSRSEQLATYDRLQKVGLDLGYELNGKRMYLRERLSLHGDWLGGAGNARIGSDRAMAQAVKRGDRTLANRISVLMPKAGYLRLVSDIYLTTGRWNLSLDDADSHYEQRIRADRFLSTHSMAQQFDVGRLTFEYRIEHDLLVRRFNLVRTPQELASDSLFRSERIVAYANRLFRQALSFEPIFHFGLGARLTMSLRSGLSYVMMRYSDGASGSMQPHGWGEYHPVLHCNWRLTARLALELEAQYAYTLSHPMAPHSVSLFSDPLTAVRSPMQIGRQHAQRYSSRMQWSDELRALFAHMQFGLSLVGRATTRDVLHDGDARIGHTLRRVDSRSTLWTVEGAVSRRISRGVPLLGLSLALEHGNEQVLRNGLRLRIARTKWQLEPSILLSLYQGLSVQYSARGGIEMLNLATRFATRHWSVAQDGEVAFSTGKWHLSMHLSHRYQTELANRQMFFLSARVGYSVWRMRFQLEGYNLLNQKEYIARYREEGHEHMSRYALRPVSVALRVNLAM